jgi:hypothetical protein
MISFKSYCLNRLDEDMRPLTPAEWNKPNAQTGESRTAILKTAIETGQTITLVSNKEVVIANTPKNLAAIVQFEKDNKKFTLTTKDNRIISSSDIGKSPLFGGGKGAGGGTEATAIAESAQCVWIAAMLKYGVDKPIEFFTPEILAKEKSKFDIGKTTLEQVFNIDPAWAYSSYESAKILIKNKFVNNKQVFHRDSAKHKAVYAAKKKAFANSDLPNLNDDKWNPGDIWAIDPSVDLNKDLDISSIGALNDSLLRLYKERKVVGISLKLIKKNAKFDELNYDASQLDTHKLVSANLKTDRGTFFSNKSGVVVFDAGKMEIRANSDMGTNKIEITGKTARGGGAGWGIIIAYAKRYLKYNMPEHLNIKRDAIAITKGDKRTIKEFFTMAKFCEPSLVEKDFYLNLASQKPGWVSSKLASTYVCYALLKNKGKKTNDFITAIVNYAGSKSEDASVYVKVYE